MTTIDDLRRLTDESRQRLADLQERREQCRLIATQSRLRLDESRRLLERTPPAHQV